MTNVITKVFVYLLFRLPLTFQRSLDEARSGSSVVDGGSVSKHKQILISYVRAEAADYALRLKRSLTHRGFSVFLVSILRYYAHIQRAFFVVTLFLKPSVNKTL